MLSLAFTVNRYLIYMAWKAWVGLVGSVDPYLNTWRMNIYIVDQIEDNEGRYS